MRVLAVFLIAAAPAMAQPVTSAFGPPAHSPDHLDFGVVWDGESSQRSLSFTTQKSGAIRLDIPPGPFYVMRIRELGAPSTDSKNSPQPVQAVAFQELKGQTMFTGQPPPWTYSAVAAGDQIVIDVVFKPKFDISTMMAGPKSSSMKVSGPGTAAPWTMSVPLGGMFNGKHTMPLVILPEKEIVAAVESSDQVQMPVRIVAAGEDVSGSIVFPSLAPGLTPTGPNFQISGSETKDVQMMVRGPGGHNDTPLDGTLALQFSRKGETVKQQTPPVGFRVTFVPASFTKNLGSKTCNGVQISSARLTVTAAGLAEFSADFSDAARQVRFEVFFPQANRTLMHTNAEISDAGGRLSILPAVRPEENSPMNGVSSDSAGHGMRFSAHIDPGPKDTLNKYHALLRSSAELRCW